MKCIYKCNACQYILTIKPFKLDYPKGRSIHHYQSALGPGPKVLRQVPFQRLHQTTTGRSTFDDGEMEGLLGGFYHFSTIFAPQNLQC